MEYLFPIDKIGKGNKCAIWGGGEAGKKLYEWNKRFQYCDIVVLFDKDSELEFPYNIKVDRVDNWENYDFEKIIITMTRNLEQINDIVKKIKLPIEKCVFLAKEEYYIDHSYSRYYSQSGEDIIICFLLKILGRKEISFLDIGVNDPFVLNNTYLIECNFKINKGVLVEPNPMLFDKIKKMRGNNICLNCGVTDSLIDVPLTFYVMDAHTLSSFIREEVDECIKHGFKIKDEIIVPCKNINEIMENYFKDGIDVMSIDTEGFDERIIKSMNLSKYRPSIICTETSGYCKGKEKEGLEIIRYLLNNDYIVWADTQLNTIFVDRNALDLESYGQTICPIILER